MENSTSMTEGGCPWKYIGGSNYRKKEVFVVCFFYLMTAILVF